MPITERPEEERPREKLLSRGAQALTDAELLAIFLHTGVLGKSAVDLLAELGRLKGLFSADEKGFCRVKGLGKAKYAQVQAMLALSRRYTGGGNQGPGPVDQPGNDAHLPQGLAVPLCARGLHLRLSRQSPPRDPIRCKELFQSTIDGANVHPREVVRRALELHAAAVIFTHNHPRASPRQARRTCGSRNV